MDNSLKDVFDVINETLEDSENWMTEDDWEEDVPHDIPHDFYEKSDQLDHEVYKDGDFVFVEPKYQEPRNETDKPNRIGRLYNEDLPLKISVLVDTFNVSNQRYVNHFFTKGVTDLLVAVVDDDPYQAALTMYTFSVLLTTAKDDEYRSHLTAAIEMIWDSYTNACYGYLVRKKSGEVTFLSHFEYEMFYTALNFLNLFHKWLYPLEERSGRFKNNSHAVSRFTLNFLDREDVIDHLYRIQPDFEDKEPPLKKRVSKSKNKRYKKNRNNKNRK